MTGKVLVKKVDHGCIRRWQLAWDRWVAIPSERVFLHLFSLHLVRSVGRRYGRLLLLGQVINIACAHPCWQPPLCRPILRCSPLASDAVIAACSHHYFFRTSCGIASGTMLCFRQPECCSLLPRLRTACVFSAVTGDALRGYATELTKIH
jgi:hypothetical protein